MLVRGFCELVYNPPDTTHAQHFREFLDHLHETCGVIDTTVWERRMASPLRDPELTATDVDEYFEGLRTRMGEALMHGMGPRIMGIDKASRPERNTPERKAMALLYKKLDKGQRIKLRKVGHFDYRGKAGRYIFKLDDMSGVRLITTQQLGGREIKTTYTLCIQSQVPDMPKGDVILARYLECRADEDKFLATCNFREAHTPDEAAFRHEVIVNEALRQMAREAGLPAHMLRSEEEQDEIRRQAAQERGDML
jgi:hypothetical protein